MKLTNYISFAVALGLMVLGIINTHEGKKIKKEIDIESSKFSNDTENVRKEIERKRDSISHCYSRDKVLIELKYFEIQNNLGQKFKNDSVDIDAFNKFQRIIAQQKESELDSLSDQWWENYSSFHFPVFVPEKTLLKRKDQLSSSASLFYFGSIISFAISLIMLSLTYESKSKNQPPGKFSYLSEAEKQRLKFHEETSSNLQKTAHENGRIITVTDKLKNIFYAIKGDINNYEGFISVIDQNGNFNEIRRCDIVTYSEESIENFLLRTMNEYDAEINAFKSDPAQWQEGMDVIYEGKDYNVVSEDKNNWIIAGQGTTMKIPKQTQELDKTLSLISKHPQEQHVNFGKTDYDQQQNDIQMAVQAAMQAQQAKSDPAQWQEGMDVVYKGKDYIVVSQNIDSWILAGQGGTLMVHKVINNISAKE